MTQPSWDNYAEVFAPVTTRFQAQMYETAAALLSGSVLDCGCGPCKLAPYLTDNMDISAYMGVDYTKAMVQIGEQTLEKVGHPDFSVQCNRIESTEGTFNSVVSLQSYYSWDEPAGVLAHIYDCLEDGGRLVLASANDQLDIHELLRQSSREWLLYAGWDSFAEYNRRLAALPQGRFVTLDVLVGELRNTGFVICDANTSLFQGGLNFVVAEKLVIE